MTIHQLQLHLPSPLFDRLKQRADEAQRPIEHEVLDVLTSAVPAVGELSPDLTSALAALALLDDESLKRAASRALAAEDAAEMQSLHEKRQRQGLTEDEARTLAGLVGQYERIMLIRAQAAALLKDRGHDVSQPPTAA